MGENFLFKVGLALGGYFLILKPILEKIGLQKTDKEKLEEQAAQEASDRKNDSQPLPVTWQPKDFNEWQPESINKLATYVKGMNQSTINKGGSLSSGYFIVPLYASLPNRLAVTINEADGFWTSAKTGWNLIDSTIRECPNKLAVAYLCKVYKNKYNIDLKSYLDSSATGLHFFDDSKNILAGINKYVSNLPTGLFYFTTATKTLKLVL